MKNNSVLWSLVSLLFLLPVTSQAEKDDIIKAGDFFALALPLSAYSGTAIASDKDGAIMFTKSLASAVTITWAGKQIAGKFRPKGTSDKSFPSGHSSSAFSGASFLYTRYGKTYGIPAYGAAIFTAYSRVHAEAHHIDDVMAGASIGMFSNWYFVTPYESRVVAYPTVYKDGYLLNLNITGSQRKPDISDRGRWRYALYFGPADQRNNTFRVPNNITGDTINLVSFRERNDPTTTANIVITGKLDDRSEILLSIEPFEVRDIGQFNSSVNFAGSTFPANTDIYSRFRLIDTRLEYSYNFLPGGKWDLKLGGALSAQRTVLELETADATPVSYGKVDDWVILPLLHLETGYKINNYLSVIAEVSGYKDSQDEQLDGSLMINYIFDRHWDAGIGYAEYNRVTDTAELYNDARFNVIVMNVGYTF